MKRPSFLFLLGLLIGLVLIPAGAWLYLSLGFAPVATAAPPLPLERTITQMALHARIRKEAPSQSPVSLTDANLIDGARAYRGNCAVCHGLPGQSPTAVANGMFPKPPQLFRGHGVTDDPVGETYWKVENGIRLTGMPGFKQSVSEDEIWKMSLMLAHADKLPAEATDILKQPPAPE